MKNFLRSVAGKTLAFIVCFMSLCLLAGCFAGAVFLTQNDMKIYRISEEELRSEVVIPNSIKPRAYDIVWSELNGNTVEDSGLIYMIEDPAHIPVAISAGAEEGQNWQYTLSFPCEKVEGDLIISLRYSSPEADPESLYTIHLSVPESSPVAYEIEFLNKIVHLVYSLRYAVYGIGLAALLLAIISFVALMSASARRACDDGLYPGPLNKLPFEILLAAVVMPALMGINMSFNYYGTSTLDIFVPFLLLASAALYICLFLALCMSAAARIKQHNLLTNTIIFRCLKIAWKTLCAALGILKKAGSFILSLISSLPLIWKSASLIFLIALIELIWIIISAGYTEFMILFFCIEKIILVPAFIYLTLMLRRLQQAGSALAAGDLSYHSDTKGLFLDFKQHAENLNSIAGGMAIAVEERLKSERMKTELITNVSHDIKTPLTSIINYALLIGDEPCENEKIKEYSEVLVRQSDKLKRLIDDLVEASKASSGNIDILLAPCDAAVFLSQASGEYEERLTASELSLISKVPEKPISIMADGRRMWRIFDNLINNICKYAQPGTRVYMSLEEDNGDAVISFKNTSKNPLDISEEELMERFTRGDSSRSTEGNGLGLSIAKSMAELQGGRLSLSIDGDLFKAVLRFPAIK